jgi:hypothetical protein
MRRFTPNLRSLAFQAGFALAVAGAAAPAAAQPPAPAVGAWATYEWKSSARIDVPVVVQQPGQAGAAPTWSVDRETSTPSPIFVTYGIVRGDAKSYVLQILTRQSPDGPPLSVTQITVDRVSGKTLKAVIRDRKGVIPTPESGFRPFRESETKGTREEVAVPAGRFTAVRAPYRNGTVWLSDRVPALGLVKGTFADGELQLVKSGTAGAQDLLRS